MTKLLRTGHRALLASACSLVFAGAVAAQQPFAAYHDHAELTAALQRIARTQPDLARIVDLGESRGSRAIQAIEIANRSGVPPGERPALLIVANLEGDQLFGSELALTTAEWLLTQYAGNEAVRRVVDERAIYIVPRVNPDGAEDMFAAVRTGRRTNLGPYDDDTDARMDEDPAEDLNGDGMITIMRVRDPSGPYMIHPADPRLMKRADPAKGEAGGWALYIEGTDTDSDGFYNEDGVGGVDLNRNWPHAYPYYQPDAGPHMVSEPETRALIEYLLSRRNVAAILAFGGSDNLVSAPNARGELAAAVDIALPKLAMESNAEARSVGVFSTTPQFGFGFGGFGGGFGGGGGGAQQSGARGGGGQRPATTVDGKDLEYFRAVSEKYRELTGIRRLSNARTPAGAFFEYGYYQYGVPAFSTPGWGLPEAAPAEGGERGAGSDDPDVRVLRWFDADSIDGFVAWTPYRHPQLGEVEIGGFRPHAATNPPHDRLAELAPAHGEFALYLAGLLPSVRIASTKVTAHGGGVFRIEADIENTGYLPTAMAQGVRAESVRPVMVQLGVPNESIITGDAKTNYIDALDGSGKRRSFQWVVRAEPGTRVELVLRSQKSGAETVTLTLR